jgi:hypothetical protein
MKKTVFIVPHQHFDVVWRREISWYQQRRAKLYKQIFGMLEEYPEFTYTLSQAGPFQEFLDANPEYYSAAKNYLDEGRLEFIGGSWTIPDLNMSRGESVLRNVRAGKRWFEEKLGYTVRAGAFEDAFGVPDQLPGLLNLAGYEFYKAGRMPRPLEPDVCGDFIWKGRAGASIKCISPQSGCSDWGWGYPDNPDMESDTTEEERCKVIIQRLKSAVENADKFPVFYMMTGEEHDIPNGIVEEIRTLNNVDKEVEYIFSTFTQYYDVLPEDYWLSVPCYDENTDLSRLFTGCYSSRMDSKLQARDLEGRLLAKSLAGERFGDDVWRSLFELQFHDAICGCHIDENAAFLRERYSKALSRTAIEKVGLPWSPVLPDFMSGNELDELNLQEKTVFGGFEIIQNNGFLCEIMLNGSSYGKLCDILLREDSGTLWTEEYSSKKFCFDDSEKIESAKFKGDIIELTTVGGTADFKKMWPGFSRFFWKKKYIFHRNPDMVFIKLETDWLGNSTEAALSWNAPQVIKSCRGEIPFGSRCFEPGQESGDTITGDAFPVLNWVATENYTVFNRGTSGHALRDGKLETIFMRSPVKRWAPWFPVTPTTDCWDNGCRTYEFLWCPADNNMNSRLHKIGIEFNLKELCLEEQSERYKNLPDNLMPADCFSENDNEMLLFYETEGRKAVWKHDGQFVEVEPWGIVKIRG